MQVENPERAGSAHAPTRVLKAREDVQLGDASSADSLLKSSLLAGTGGKLGRFHVLRQLGEGGMSLVFLAYDEELDRKVALKLLRSRQEEGSVGHRRLLREAQALARLSHPNVVTVYEVGEYKRQVFLALEYVQGHTLREWLQAAPRTYRDVVRVFVEAGRGLAAAHAAELLHRDFKPDNVLIGDDGRVRVADFGLALAQDRQDTEADLVGQGLLPENYLGSAPSLTRTGTLVGTPAYMAPERFHEHAGSDVRTDQYSFCVALYEALYGARPFVADSVDELRRRVLAGVPPDPPRNSAVPSWLRKVVLRGLAYRPDDRFSSMDALLVALERDPQRTRARALGGLALAGALVAGGYAAAQTEAEAAVTVCPEVRAQLGPIWDDRRADVERALLATDVAYAQDTWTRVQQQLDRYADDWAAAHRDACLAHQRGEHSDAALDLRMTCLQRRRSALSYLVERLVKADREVTRAAVGAAAALPSIERCADVAALTAAIAPPEDPGVAAQVAALRERIAVAEAAAETRQLEDAATITEEVVRAAEPLEYRPLLAEAQALRGKVTRLRGAYAEAADQLRDALWQADVCRDDELLAGVMEDLVFVIGDKLRDRDAALGWWRHAEAVMTRLGEAAPGYATLLRAFGRVHAVFDEHEQAHALLTRSLALAERLYGPDDHRLIQYLQYLGRVEFSVGGTRAAQPLFERALTIAERKYGPNHPEVGQVLTSLANVAYDLGDLERAQHLNERSLVIHEGALGADHPSVATILSNLGGILTLRKDLERAREMLTRAVELHEKALGPHHPSLGAAEFNLGQLLGELGDHAAGRAHLERALEIRKHAHAPGHLEIAETIAELGILEHRAGAPKKAIPRLEEARAMLAGGDARGAFTRAYVDFMLAKALHASGKAARAKELAKAALTQFRTMDAGDVSDMLQAIEAFLADPARHQRP